MLRRFNLTEAEKNNIRILVDRSLRGRKWWNKYINSYEKPSVKDKEVVLYATYYALTEYCGCYKPRDFTTISDEELKNLQLDKKLEMTIMKDVPEIDGIDMNYIVRLLFPGHFKESDQDFVKHLIQNFFCAVLDGEKAFPKHYFDRKLYNEIALTRGRACLEYVINEHYTSLQDAYIDFASNGIITKLRAVKLAGAYKQCAYLLPIEYLHDTVVNTPEHTEYDELLYQKLRFTQYAAQYQLELEQLR